MWNLLGLFSSIIISGILISVWSGVMQVGQNRQIYAAAASEFQDLLTATNRYVVANSAQLSNSVSANGSWLDLNTLIASNLLPPNFSNQNPFGQVWGVYLRQPQTGQIQAVVLSSSGTTLGLPALSAVVGMAGGQSGYVPPDNVLPNINSGTAIGNMGKWRMSLAGLPNPGSGHFYGLGTSASNAQYNNDYLYRANVPGHPELNGMNAPLNMNGNDINAIGNAQVNNNIQVGNQVTAQSAQLGSGSSLHLGSQAQIFNDSQNLALRTNGATYIQHADGSASDLYAGTLIGNRVQVSGGNNIIEGTASFYGDENNAAVRTPGQFYVQHQDGSLADANIAQVFASTGVLLNGNAAPGSGCPKNGMISASNDGSGTTLACINGQWSSLVASFNSGSWVSNWLNFNATNGPFTNNARTAAAVNVICSNRTKDLRVQILMDGTVIWDSGAFVGSGYDSTQSGSVIIPAGKAYYVIPSGYPNANGQCYIAARW